MGAFHDATKVIDERATERMSFRTEPHINAAIHRAATLGGVDDSVFSKNAAYTFPLETIAAHECTGLASVDVSIFRRARYQDGRPSSAPIAVWTLPA